LKLYKNPQHLHPRGVLMLFAKRRLVRRFFRFPHQFQEFVKVAH